MLTDIVKSMQYYSETNISLEDIDLTYRLFDFSKAPSDDNFIRKDVMRQEINKARMLLREIESENRKKQIILINLYIEKMSTFLGTQTSLAFYNGETINVYCNTKSAFVRLNQGYSFQLQNGAKNYFFTSTLGIYYSYIFTDEILVDMINCKKINEVTANISQFTSPLSIKANFFYNYYFAFWYHKELFKQIYTNKESEANVVDSLSLEDKKKALSQNIAEMQSCPMISANFKMQTILSDEQLIFAYISSANNDVLSEIATTSITACKEIGYTSGIRLREIILNKNTNSSEYITLMQELCGELIWI